MTSQPDVQEELWMKRKHLRRNSKLRLRGKRRCLEDSLVTVISQQSFAELLSTIPAVALSFIRLLSKRLATVERRLAEFGHTWSHHRLARVLLQLSKKMERSFDLN